MPLFRTTLSVEKKQVIDWGGWVNGEHALGNVLTRRENEKGLLTGVFGTVLCRARGWDCRRRHAGQALAIRKLVAYRIGSTGRVCQVTVVSLLLCCC